MIINTCCLVLICIPARNAHASVLMSQGAYVTLAAVTLAAVRTLHSAIMQVKLASS